MKYVASAVLSSIVHGDIVKFRSTNDREIATSTLCSLG